MGEQVKSSNGDSQRAGKRIKRGRVDMRVRNAAASYLVMTRGQVLVYLGLSMAATLSAKHPHALELLSFCRHVRREVKRLRHTDWYRNRRNASISSYGWGCLDCVVLNLYLEDHRVSTLRVGSELVPAAVCYQALCVLLLGEPSLQRAASLTAVEAQCFAFAMGAQERSEAGLPQLTQPGGAAADGISLVMASRAGGLGKGATYTQIREYIRSLIVKYPGEKSPPPRRRTARWWADTLKADAIPAISSEFGIDMSVSGFYDQVSRTLREQNG